ncbi:MAG: Wzz/FepE/Etk N-terminal domain-containing protein [Silicimonas sp.]|nr:Wzz/FepE/Etk N-terminal domain-containing protein [Silicimonas sp.]
MNQSRHSNLVSRYISSDDQISDEHEVSFDVRSLFRSLKEGRWILASTVLVATLLGLLASSRIEATYKASAKVMFDPQLREIAAGGLVNSFGLGEEGLQNEIQVLRSTTLVNKVIDALTLDTLAEFNPTLQQSEPSLLERLFNAPQIESDAESLPTSALPELERRIVADNVLDRLRLTPIQSSRVIDIGFIASDPETSARVANAFAEQYIQDQLDARISTTLAATGWLSSRVDEWQERLQADERAVEAARSMQSAEAGQSVDITQRQIDSLVDILTETQNEAHAARAGFERLRAALRDRVDFASVPEFRASILMVDLFARTGELEQQRANLVELLPEDHGSVVEIGRLLAQLDQQQLAEAEHIVEVARTEWQALEEQMLRIQSDIGELHQDMARQSQAQLAIRQLEREAEASRRQYESHLERLNTASEQVTLESADARILSFAEPPLSTFSQAKRRAIVIAIIAGIVLGTFLIFLRERLDNTIKTPDQLNRLTGREILGATPNLKGKPTSAQIFRTFAARRNSHYAETIRGLRTSILYSGGEQPPGVVMFTSSLPGEGKSLLATVMALASFRMNKKTIIVDCDLRRPKVGKILGIGADRVDLLSILDGTHKMGEAIRREPATGLHSLSTSADHTYSHSSAIDMISSPNFASAIMELRENYDLVVLDAPPSLLSADAKIISEQADAIVYVVRWNKTPAEAVLEGMRTLETIGAPVAGVVLSMVNAGRAPWYRAEDASLG